MFLFIFPTTISNLLNYHRLFLPMIGMAFLLQPLDHLKSMKWKLTTGVLVVGLLAILINENLHFQKSFVDRKSFWSNAYLFSPNSILANGGMAWTYHMNHQNDSAMYFYSRMIEIEPDRDQTRLGMAIIAEEMGDLETTDSLIIEEFKVTKDSANVYYYIGQILLERGDTAGAVKNLNLGKDVVLYSRNARTYFDTLDVEVLKQIILPN